MNIVYILIAIGILCFIVTAHELGHFLVGKACGIGVVEFSVGFGPKLLQWKGKETKYSLRAIPLGGYCQFVGEDEDNAAPNAMNNQPIWKRFLTVLAGPAMNFLLGIVLTIVLFLCFGISDHTVPQVDRLIEGMPAAQYGILEGDLIVSVNGVEIPNDAAGTALISKTISEGAQDAPVHFVLDRNGETVEVDVPLMLDEAEGRYMVGVQFKTMPSRYPVGFTIRYSFRYIGAVMSEMLGALKNLVFHGEGIDDVSGVVGVVAVMSEEIRRGLDTVIYLIVIISMNLGIMNLLPFPALDGGRLVLLVVEAIRGKPFNREKEGMLNLIALGLLMALMVAIAFKDIVRLIH